VNFHVGEFGSPSTIFYSPADEKKSSPTGVVCGFCNAKRRLRIFLTASSRDRASKMPRAPKNEGKLEK
jgi:hypothetical protein